MPRSISARLARALFPLLFVFTCSPVRAQTLPPGTTGIPSCTPTVAQTEGPYYLDLKNIRSNITEGKPGVPLIVRIIVLDSTTCQPLPNQTVDVWHADASGAYSRGEETFLRGSQISNVMGEVEFRSIFPGWYPGRTVHIHFKVHRPGGDFTSQLYFDDALTDPIYQQAPYSGRAGSRTRNANDGVLAGSPDPEGTLFLQTSLSNGTVTSVARAIVK